MSRAARVPRAVLAAPARGGIAVLTLVALAIAPRTSAAQEQPPPAGQPADTALVAAATRRPPHEHVTLADVIYLPLVYGIRIPSYDRSDGLSLPWGPQLALADDRLVADALVTYRSHLGHFDPSLSTKTMLSHGTSWHLIAQRATLTNDAWSVPDAFNSAATGVNGDDGRNYYRADRLQSTLNAHARHGGDDGSASIDGYAGSRFEFDHSVGPEPAARHQVWTLFNHGDTTGILRPNPPVDRGHIASAIAGGKVTWQGTRGATADGALDVEVPWTAPHDARFVQFTVDGHVEVPTISDHRFTLDAHAVATAGDTAPRQRFAYIGGGNTIPTRMMLDEGGDELAYASTMYVVPLPEPQIPFLGAPSVALRYVVGGAGIHRLPRLTQNVGPRVMLFIFRAEYLIDPVTHQHTFSFGATVSGSMLKGFM